MSALEIIVFAVYAFGMLVGIGIAAQDESDLWPLAIIWPLVIVFAVYAFGMLVGIGIAAQDKSDLWPLAIAIIWPLVLASLVVVASIFAIIGEWLGEKL